MTRTCRTCTRTMDLSQFRQFADGGRQNRCIQCENKDRAERRKLPPVGRPEPPADPLTLALRNWSTAHPAQLTATL